MRYGRSYRRQTWFAIAASILNKIFDLAPPALIGAAVDVVVKQQDSLIAQLGVRDVFTQLLILTLLSFAIWGLESLFQYLYARLWRNLAQTIQHDLRLDTYCHLQALELSYFEERSTGGLMSILNDDINQLERFLDVGANEIIQVTTTVIIISGVFFVLSPGVAWMAMLPIPIIVWGSILFQHRLAPRYAAVREQVSLLNGQLANNLTGITTIKSFTAEDYEVARIRKQSNAYRQSNQRAIALSAAFIPLIRIVILLGFVATLLYGGMEVTNGRMAVGTYSVLVFMTQRLLWPLTGLGNTLDQYQRAMASTQRVMQLLDTPIAIRPGDKSLVFGRWGNYLNHGTSDVKNQPPASSDLQSALNLSPAETLSKPYSTLNTQSVADGDAQPATLNAQEIVRGELEFRHVTFAYDGRSPAIQELSLHVPAGKTIAIVGATGSGKSTLVKLLLRLYEIQTGCITLDGIELHRLRLQDLRRAMGLVSQDTFLFHGTVAENIAYGSFGAGMDAVMAVAKVAEAHDFIMQLPQGYDTIVGERGQKLSGGQRQRLAIARAVLKDPPILILDEATSAVDNETEAAIQRSLETITLNRTTIAIAHRLSTVRNADCIYVMDKGRLVESGKHEHLLAQRGIYAKLWNVQTGLR